MQPNEGVDEELADQVDSAAWANAGMSSGWGT